MNRQPITDTLKRVASLSQEIDDHVPGGRPSNLAFRSDLAGLLNVTICATYENCVKLVLQDYAGRQNHLFRTYAQNQYNKINSRIDIGDLHRYARTFHPAIGTSFKDGLNREREYFLRRTNYDIIKAYCQILEWRHDFAHTGQRITTVEEVVKFHKIAKRVVLVFSDAFSSFPA